MIGQVVGNYKILQALGEGGVGMVYKGVDTMLDREVAIKVLRPELASQTSVVERFRSEAVTLAKLSHPNIATLYSLFRHGEHLFMVLEYIQGETLDHLLYRRGLIPTDEAIPYFCQALEGINYAHERGIVHRDIKPGNMMLAHDGILKVLDFGIARLLGTNRMTRVGNVIGTLEYMSPEQVKGLDTDARSDVYGLGIMLYEILTGKLPFESENDFELMKMQTEQMPVLPRQLNPEIPVEIEDAIIKAVAKNPDDRFNSAGEFLETFFELGYAIPTKTLGFGSVYGLKRPSRPSTPGIKSGETEKLSTEPPIPVLQSQIPTEPIITLNQVSATPETLEVGKDLNKSKSNESNAENTGEVKGEIKGTRLAPNNQGEIKGTRLAPTNPNEIKATRLGESSTGESTVFETPKSPTFFEKLTWVHYAGASSILLFFLGLAGIAAILPLMWGDEPPKAKETPKKIEQVQTPEPKKPEVVTTPTAQPTVNPSNFSQNPQTPSLPLPSNTIPEVSENPPRDTTYNRPTKNPIKEREQVKNNPQPQPIKRNDPPSNKTVDSKGDRDKIRDLIRGKNDN
jgi:serine/threonine protein kinase